MANRTSEKRVAIVQSNYIPWKGYFDMIAAVDEFILYDDMQFTRRDWRNRNRIKTRSGLRWLTVPVKTKGRYYQSIRDTEIDGSDWAPTHWKTLTMNYRRAAYFDEIAAWLEPLYLNDDYETLTQLNRRFLDAVCRYLGISTVIRNSWDYRMIDGKSERLADLCLQAGGTEYVSGPSAKAYIDEEVFLSNDLRFSWFNYSDFPEYPQLFGDFVHGVTILDLLFNCGPSSPKFMRFVEA